MKALLTANQALVMIVVIVAIGIILMLITHYVTKVRPRGKARRRLIDIMQKVTLGTYNVIITPGLRQEATDIVRKYNFRTKHVGKKNLDELRHRIKRLPDQFVGWPYLCDEMSGKFDSKESDPLARKLHT